MNKPLFWILDNEWDNHKLEISALKSAIPDCEIRETRDSFLPDLEAFGKDTDLIITQIDYKFSSDVIKQLKRCKGIAVMGSGYDNVDVIAAKECGIPVANVNGYCAEDLADYVLAAIFYHYKRIHEFNENITDGRWGAQAIKTPIHRLSQQRLFLMGFGFIGKVVAQRAKALGMKVMVYDPYLPKELFAKNDVQCVELEQGLREADFVSVHMRLTAENQGIINKDYFEKMKPSAVFINVARGGLVNEADLAEALGKGAISGAVLDVVAQEPISFDNPLLRVPNCLITPHISFGSEEATIDLRLSAVRNGLSMFRNERPLGLVQC